MSRGMIQVAANRTETPHNPVSLLEAKSGVNPQRSIKPNFFVVGAPKTGTTSIAAFLERHPEIYVSPIKEPHHFSTDIRMVDFSPEFRAAVYLDVSDYLSRVPLPKKHNAIIDDLGQYLGLFREVTTERVVGELSTGYLYSSRAAENLSRFNPDAKIVMILRQPVERAYSHFLMNVRDFWDYDSGFLDALDRDFSSTEKGWGRSHLYVELGLYSAQVARYLKFFPRDQVKIYFYEDLVGSQMAVLENLSEFLGVDFGAWVENVDSIPRENVAALPKLAVGKTGLAVMNKYGRRLAKLLPQNAKTWIRQALRSAAPPPKLAAGDFNAALKYFEDDIERLSALTGRDLQSWIRRRDSV
jgi:hypothetical protein